MARVTNGITGEISGKLGGLVFHRRNGKQFVRQRPESFLPGTDPESVDRRSRFAFSVKLGAAIYSVPELSAIWRKAAPKNKSVFNFIVGNNSNRVTARSITESSVIVPPFDVRSMKKELAVTCIRTSISSGSIDIELTPPGNAANAKEVDGRPAMLLSVICLARPVNRSLPAFAFVAAVSTLLQIELDTSVVFNISLGGQDRLTVENYEERKVLFTVAALDDKNNPAYYSATIVK